MSLNLDRCPSSLDLGYTAFSPKVLRKMFGGKKVSPLLPYVSLNLTDKTVLKIFQENQKHISISGYQEKYSIVLENNTLRLADKGEQGTYILKPISNYLKNKEYAPANEHLTMQIAKQIFKMEVAENTLVFFQDGSPAYLTKRFDVKDDKSKLAVEDFASLLERTPYTHGEHYKYSGSYLDLFLIMKKYLPAWYFDGNEKSKRVQEKCGFTYSHTEYSKPVPLMNDIRTEHFTKLTQEEWRNNQATVKKSLTKPTSQPNEGGGSNEYDGL